jgi:hypothetical protein
MRTSGSKCVRVPFGCVAFRFGSRCTNHLARFMHGRCGGGGWGVLQLYEMT